MWKALAPALAVFLSLGSPAFAQRPSDATPRPTIPAPAIPQSPPRLVSEPRFISKAVEMFDRRASRGGPPKDGFYLEMGNSMTGAGLIAAGPGYRQHVLKRQAIVSASGTVSVRLYTMAQARIEFPAVTDRISVGAQTFFRDALQVNYFGRGNDSSESHRSGYRLRTNDITSYVSVGSPALSVRARGGWLKPVSIGPMAGRLPAYPSTVTIFTEREAPGLNSEPSFLHGDLAVSSDTRDYPGHPTAGGFYQATWTLYADQTTGQHSFQRYEVEASHYVPLGSDTWVLALRGAAVFSSVEAGKSVPFYLMPNLGGRNLRAFADYRFHDNNMQSYGVESRWKLFSHVDAVAFVDAGSVAPTIGQLRFSDVKSGYGAGIRLHNQKATIARLDVARGAEGWRILVRLNDPFRRSAQSNGWRPAAPFLP